MYPRVHRWMDYDCIIIPGQRTLLTTSASLVGQVQTVKYIQPRERDIPIMGSAGDTRCSEKLSLMPGYESDAGTYDGLGLLDCVTRFASYEKNTFQVRRNACQVPPLLSAMGEVSGYEIHMGVTESVRNREAFKGDGRVSDDGLVFGTYLHGLFLNPSAVNALLSYLFARKGLPFTPIPAGESDPYDVLADLYEEHVDMDAIVALLTS